MIVKVEKSFARDVNKIRDKKILQKIRNLISIVENSKSVYEIPHIKKIKGYNSFYRIKVGEYRLGLEEIPGQIISFIRFLHRKEIYRYFPDR